MEAATEEDLDNSELPEMVPVSVHSDLPEFQNVTIERVLVGLDLTWIEFLALFQVSLDSSQCVVKGTGGRQANLTNTVRDGDGGGGWPIIDFYPKSLYSRSNCNVGEYVNTLRRRMKVYPVTIEKISASPTSKCGSQPTPSNGEPLRPGAKRKVQPPTWYNTTNDTNNEEPPTKTSLIVGDEKSIKSGSDSLPSSTTSSETVAGPSRTHKEAISKTGIPLTNGNLTTYPNEDSSSSDEEETILGPQIPEESQAFNAVTSDEFEIKPSVIQFLITKISNKNMVRIREELLRLKARDDYFQLTCVAPLAAGLLEQMLCRTNAALNL